MTIATTTDWLAAARALYPLVEKWRDAGEQERRLPKPLFDAINDAGIFKLMVHPAFGGHRVALKTMVAVVEELSRQDGAVGWNVMISAGGGAFADYIPEDAAREIFGGSDVTVGSFAPTGQAIPVPGGYRCSGRWDFGSGCQNATWISGGFLIMEDGGPRMSPAGGPDTLVGIMPTSECEIFDTWHSAGLKGTGSNDYQVKDLFIPADHTFPMSSFFTGPPERDSRAYTQPFFDAVGPLMASVSLGIARDAIASFQALAASKTPAAGRSTLATQATAQLRVGMAEAKLRSARAYIYDTVHHVENEPRSSPEEFQEVAAAVRLACAYATQTATEAVDLMFDAAGGTSVYQSSRLERCFRDIHMVTHHILMSPSNIEMVGQYLLGQGLGVRR